MAEAARRIREKGYSIGNVDSTIIAQAGPALWCDARKY